MKPLKQKAVSAVAEKLIESQISSDDTVVTDAETILDSMSEEDREVINDIVDSHISAETISDISSYIINKDTSGLKEYAKETLSEEELAEFKDLYQKYKADLPSYRKRKIASTVSNTSFYEIIPL